MRVLCEGHRAPALTVAEAVGEQACVHLFGEGGGVAEGNVGFVRGRAGRHFVKDLAHLGGLVLGPLADGRAAADGRVLLLDLSGAPSGDKRSEVRL